MSRLPFERQKYSLIHQLTAFLGDSLHSYSSTVIFKKLVFFICLTVTRAF